MRLTSALLERSGSAEFFPAPRNLSARFSGASLAINAEFTAPIEMPATQSGGRFASARAWIPARLRMRYSVDSEPGQWSGGFLKLNAAGRVVQIDLNLPHFLVDVVSDEIVQYLY
jgi:hypothetical protein